MHACCVHCQFSANTVCVSVVVGCMYVVSVARLVQTVCVFVVFFGCTSLTPSCFQRGTGVDRDPRRWGKGETAYRYTQCHHHNDSCIKMGTDESHFNAALIVRVKVTIQCPPTTIFAEKGQPKRNRIEVFLLTSLTPYRWAKPAHDCA